MDKRKIALGVALAACLSGIYYGWQQSPAENSPKVVLTADNKGQQSVPPLPQEEKPQALKDKVMKQYPAQDEFVYNFEGAKVYIVAGSVKKDKTKQLWQAKIKTVNAKEQLAAVQEVFFKQEGQRIVTRNGEGKWRELDEMDSSLYKKVTDIAGNL